MSINAASERFLAQVERLIDWAPLSPLLEGLVSGGLDAPPASVKMLLLARWYGLSETALLEACQDRLSFRRFLGLAPVNGVDDARLAEAFRRHTAQAALQSQQLLDAIEAQLLASGYTITPGSWAEPGLIPASPSDAADGSETALFQPGELEELLKRGEGLFARGGARVSTKPPYQTGPVELTPPPPRATAPLQAIIEWPWGATTALEQHLNVGREVGFSPFAPELEPHLHVSRRHAELTACPEGVWVRDLRSRNGTFVNGEELPRGQAYLVDTDARIRFGPYCVVTLKLVR